MKKFLLFAVAALLLFGCLEREDGLDKWSPAGSTAQPNLNIFNSPSPQASAAASSQPGVTPSPTASAHPSASVAAPSVTPSPAAPAINCNVSVASGSTALQKQVIVKFSSSVSATVKCWVSAQPQSVQLTQGASGTFNGFATCTYSGPGTFTVSASGGGASCEKDITVSAS